MIGYPVSYGDYLTQDEANKRLKEVQVGAMLVISLYLILTQAANAVDSGTQPPGTSGAKQPPVTSAAPNTSCICPAPQPTGNGTGKEILAGVSATICSTAVNTGNFWIGVFCGLIVIGGMTMIKKD